MTFKHRILRLDAPELLPFAMSKAVLLSARGGVAEQYELPGGLVRLTRQQDGEVRIWIEAGGVAGYRGFEFISSQYHLRDYDAAGVVTKDFVVAPTGFQTFGTRRLRASVDGSITLFQTGSGVHVFEGGTSYGTVSYPGTVFGTQREVITVNNEIVLAAVDTSNNVVFRHARLTGSGVSRTLTVDPDISANLTSAGPITPSTSASFAVERSPYLNAFAVFATYRYGSPTTVGTRLRAWKYSIPGGLVPIADLAYPGAFITTQGLGARFGFGPTNAAVFSSTSDGAFADAVGGTGTFLPIIFKLSSSSGASSARTPRDFSTSNFNNGAIQVPRRFNEDGDGYIVAYGDIDHLVHWPGNTPTFLSRPTSLPDGPDGKSISRVFDSFSGVGLIAVHSYLDESFQTHTSLVEYDGAAWGTAVPLDAAVFVDEVSENTLERHREELYLEGTNSSNNSPVTIGPSLVAEYPSPWAQPTNPVSILLSNPQP